MDKASTISAILDPRSSFQFSQMNPNQMPVVTKWHK